MKKKESDRERERGNGSSHTQKKKNKLKWSSFRIQEMVEMSSTVNAIQTKIKEIIVFEQNSKRKSAQ